MLVAHEMKFSLSQISQAIAEEMKEVRDTSSWKDKGFFSDREASPHDDSMYGDPEGGYQAKLQVVADKLMEVHSLLEEEADSGDHEMHESQQIEQISEAAYEMYQRMMHIIEGSMSE